MSKQVKISDNGEVIFSSIKDFVNILYDFIHNKGHIICMLKSNLENYIIEKANVEKMWCGYAFY